SKQAIQQVNASVDAMLQKDLVDALAVQIENFGFNGTGTSPQPRGTLATAGIGAVLGGTNDAQFNWGHMVGLESACANANAEPDVGAGYAF
ncbi:phage major capsid protein, partial [Listeria monocytogenes]|uniref:phage major capsid protein n=1 Tax=Listeria monocytogenes TaxID=1639 RepID=UPI002FDBC613